MMPLARITASPLVAKAFLRARPLRAIVALTAHLPALSGASAADVPAVVALNGYDILPPAVSFA